MADAGKDTAHAQAKEEHHAGGHGVGRYFLIWIILLGFTILTVATGRRDLGGVNLPLALAASRSLRFRDYLGPVNLKMSRSRSG